MMRFKKTLKNMENMKKEIKFFNLVIILIVSDIFKLKILEFKYRFSKRFYSSNYSFIHLENND